MASAIKLVTTARVLGGRGWGAYDCGEIPNRTVSEQGQTLRNRELFLILRSDEAVDCDDDETKYDEIERTPCDGGAHKAV